MKVPAAAFNGVLRASQRVGPPNGGRAIMFVTPSSVAAVRDASIGFARATALRANRPVWLVDLDLRDNGVFHHLDVMAPSEQSQPGRAFSVAFDAAPIYRPVGKRLIATKGGVNPTKLLSLHEVPGSNLYVSRFRVEAMVAGQQLSLVRSQDWWTAARAKTDWVTVHALPLEQGGNALTLCRDVDGVVLVVEADRTNLSDVTIMQEEVEAAGGRTLGIVMVGVGADARWLNGRAA
ncbi:MAG: hypothetical protein AAFQ22_04205 [Pseudomonadota bacterium]